MMVAVRMYMMMVHCMFVLLMTATVRMMVPIVDSPCVDDDLLGGDDEHFDG